LTIQGIRFEKVHNLIYLLDLCEGDQLDLAEMRDIVELLLPYAVAIRYPGASRELSDEDGRP
jgi:hypothetical protein